jgi:DNA-binding MarR family transcriptional regulator
MASVAALLAMDRTTLTALLKPLARRGLVEALVDETDRRNRRLVLTKAGQSALAAAMPIWARENRRLEALFADPSCLRDDLNRLA